MNQATVLERSRRVFRSRDAPKSMGWRSRRSSGGGRDEAKSGSGLGLSMVLGVARQSGGNVRITSRSAQGTSIEVYLPRADSRVSSRHSFGDLVHSSEGFTQMAATPFPGETIELDVDDPRGVESKAI
jgi:hypothetical protein